MKRIAIGFFAALSIQAFASNVFSPSSASVSRGNVSAPQDLTSIRHNPAAAATFLADGDNFRMNILGSFSAGYEVGDINSLADELDELIDILEQDDLTADEAIDARDRFDPFLDDAAINGYLKASATVHLPLVPFIYHHKKWGTFTFDASASGIVRSTVLDDDINLIISNDNFQLNTLASVYVKSAGITKVSFGYSKDVWQYRESKLYAGTSLNFTNIALAKNVIALSGLEDNDNIGDAIEDDFETNKRNNGELSLDLGLLWVGENYSLGMSITDINEPEYEYGSLLANCNTRTGSSLDNCFAAQEFIARGEVSNEEVFVANSLTTVEASYWSGEDIKWGIHASYDLNDKNDPTGDLYQWLSLSGTVQFDNWLLPELRLGYSSNQTGTELDYYNAGLRFFKYIDLDVRWTDEEVEVDGDTAPRSAFFNLGVQGTF